MGGNMSQTDRIIEWLSEAWTCGTVLAADHIARYSARIHEARRRGYKIERRRCEKSQHHHRSQQYEWRIMP